MVDTYLQEWQEHADALASKLGIEPIKLIISNTIGQAYGICNAAKRTIWLREMPSGEAMDLTLRHELAHQLAYDIHGECSLGHGQHWIDACAVTGAVPEEYTAMTSDNSSYTYKCEHGCEFHSFTSKASYYSRRICTKHRAKIYPA